MRIAVLSSGGKDSSAAWWWAMCRGWDVVAVVTVDVQDGDSHMFQVPSTQWVQKQAELAELPWIDVPAFGSVEDEIGALESSLAQLEIDALVSGALRSDFQKQRLECMCQRLGIRSYSPLWHQTPIEHLRGMIEAGFEIMLTSVSCEGLDHNWLGRVLDKKSLKELQELSTKHRLFVWALIISSAASNACLANFSAPTPSIMIILARSSSSSSLNFSRCGSFSSKTSL